METSDSVPILKGTKRVFLKKGTCSRTFCFILNREFGHNDDVYERAADPLAGGILQEGDQCGMLWGSSLAVGAEAYRRKKDPDQAIDLAISATQHLLKSFSKRTNTVNCRDITHTDFKSKLEMFKYLISGKAYGCLKLASRWAPEALKAANKGLSNNNGMPVNKALGCASEVAKKMGASEEEMVMVAGFSGGMGLSGNACGALGAAIWMESLEWYRKNPGKSGYFNPMAANKLINFYDATGCEMECKKITGRSFNNKEEHYEFIKNGGCEKLINTLAKK